ncbi:glutamine--fructose-6-phosphate aminotransferase [isomerizing] [bacterium BMS3Abin15]|nr:glutamine--fructose-6-phosphate aminotransferase [isomerizing] [bacterium BMS3Abin15]HDZ85501.1 glutamine--fructose-6-phosphate transaminase (isomerizing) [Candidatus Moranbacteria bacterium]
MCGIVGYIGKQKAAPILIEGLKRLEYRGYDSAGISIIGKNKITTIKSVGKVSSLEDKIGGKSIAGNVGIAHTRWATHGKPSDKNSHPHGDCKGNIFLVHNGIIENYIELKSSLAKKGHKFKSETDSEVIVHLIEEFNKKLDFKNAVLEALKLIKGTYGLAIINKKEPEKIIAARLGSPLVLGIGGDEYVIASDASAVVRHTNQVIYLEDGEVAVIEKDNYEVTDIKDKSKNKKITKLDWSIEEAEKQGFDHFMLKEIFEQPKAIEDATRGRLVVSEGTAKLGGLRDVADKLRKLDRIIIVSCGTSYYAGLVGEYMLEEYAGIPVEVEYASEFRYRKPILDEKTAVLAISQSGETADTLEAIREGNNKGAITLGIVNTVGSTIARETTAGVYNHAGPEIGVASTKAFTSQLSVLILLTLLLGRQRQMSYVMGKRIASEMKKIPKQVEEILSQSKEIKKIAKKYLKYKNILYLGRKYNEPIALEGALKIKEISYIHAEGYPSGEMKHGPIALIDENFPSVFVVPKDSVYEKNISGMQEIKARGGKIIAIATEGDKEIKKHADDVIYIPKTLEMLTPLLSVVPLQLLAYYVGTGLGYDVDKPRNLAKSVTVE